MILIFMNYVVMGVGHCDMHAVLFMFGFGC